MKRALVFQHMNFDNTGRFSEYMAESGFVPDTVRLWEGEEIPPLAPYDLLVVLGGAMNVWEVADNPWLIAEKQAIREWVGSRAKPYIGFCLGHQLLADAMGGHVAPANGDELGVCKITVTEEGARHPLFDGLAGDHRMMQWHSMEVKTVPDGAVVLATGDDVPVQAIAVGDCAVGLQFHAEFNAQTITSWRGVPSYLKAYEDRMGEGSYARLIAEAFPQMPAMERVARRIWDNLVRG